MANFMVRFLLCNLFICIIIGILLAARILLKNILTSRMRYHLWLLLFGLLAIPFLPVKPGGLGSVFSWLRGFKSITGSYSEPVAAPAAALTQSGAADWMNDFSVSVIRKTPSAIGVILCILWFAGILAMTVLLVRSQIRLHAIKHSALPLQNSGVRKIYHRCLAEMNITKDIPVYSTAFLKSPVISGFFKPCIFLPIHLISDCKNTDIRYMLLHELQHYKHRDALANYLMNAAAIIYWFNPFVWYALKEMQSDREVACDTSVLKMLEEGSYKDYGNTLINFAEKISLTPFPFASGISGSMAQMQKRIMNIANYQPVTFRKKLHSIFSYGLIAVLLSSFVPVLSIQAAKQDYYHFKTEGKNISYPDLSTYFGEYGGSFVLYDTAEDSWQIYNMDRAVMRIAPASTYKIYIALSGLESGVITPGHSLIPWNGQRYIFDSWNADQTLASAMENSVTWYFQEIDGQIGLPSIRDYVRQIGYGNQTVSGDASSYWLNSSLKISPIEQVEMLKKLYGNEFCFSPETWETVKDSICLFSTAEGTLYGKTGTEAVNGQNTSGWFIGFMEKGNSTCFFATNIQNGHDASGTAATKLTFSILSDLKHWNHFS